MWAIFVIHYGLKMYVTSVDGHNRIHRFEKTKASASNVVKFELIDAQRILDNQTFFKTYGITNIETGLQLRSSKRIKSVYGRNFWQLNSGRSV